MSLLKVRVIPGAKKNEILGWTGETLRLKIAAPATDGKANKAVIEFIAKTLGLKRRQVIMTSGEKSREKTLETATLSKDDVREKLL